MCRPRSFKDRWPRGRVPVPVPPAAGRSGSNAGQPAEGSRRHGQWPESAERQRIESSDGQPGYKPSQSQPTPAHSDASQSDEADSPSNPSAQEPTLAKPTVARPTLARPTLAKPTASKPTLAKPTLARQSRSSGPSRPLKSRKRKAPRRGWPGCVPTSLRRRSRHRRPNRWSSVRKWRSGQRASRRGRSVLRSEPDVERRGHGPAQGIDRQAGCVQRQLRNAGDVPANNVVVTVNIPPFAEVVEAQPTAGTTRSALAPSGASRSSGGSRVSSRTWPRDFDAQDYPRRSRSIWPCSAPAPPRFRRLWSRCRSPSWSITLWAGRSSLRSNQDL